eukprot:TRINITY_DN31393_c0_g1_i1.p1 TRINITY_DN31393_c0_g1~~TRINITY_DN31393_c0_g1_i1.p1  ORF type:complete len:620 (+),score=145.97 TRINITY_DN31393_c0_g1_i1:43-1902(+)
MAASKAKRWREQDFYNILGVLPDSTTAEVKRGFRKVALTCHPDKVTEQHKEAAKERFQLIAEAYEVLGNEAKRKEYDAVRAFSADKPGAADAAKAARPPPGSEVRRATQPKAETKAPSCLWDRCGGCFSRWPKKDLNYCPVVSCRHQICSSCEACAKCTQERQQEEQNDKTWGMNEYPEIRKGTELVTIYHACVFESPKSWVIIAKCPENSRLTAAGPPQRSEGDALVPIQPKGWVDVVDLAFPDGRPVASSTSPKATPQTWSRQTAQPKNSSRQGSPNPSKVAATPAQGSAAGNEPVDVKKVVHEASRIAQEVTATAQDVIKTGYSGSSKVAQEALRLAQEAGRKAQEAAGAAQENGPWLAQEALRLAQEAAGQVWGAAAQSFPSEEHGKRGSESTSGRNQAGYPSSSGHGYKDATNGAGTARQSSGGARQSFGQGSYLTRAGSSSLAAANHPAWTNGAPSSRQRDLQPLSEDALDRKEILVIMGFDINAADSAVRRCSSVEAAVEYIMSNSHQQLVPRSSSPPPDSNSNAAGGATTAAGVVEQIGQMFTPWLKGGNQKTSAERVTSNGSAVTDACGSIEETLKSLGFSAAQAKASARRCSSIEAAVEWIALNPDVKE